MTRKLTIGVVIPQFPSLTETFFLNQVSGLCARGHNVVVFCSTHNRDEQLLASFGLDLFKNLQVCSLDYKHFSPGLVPVLLKSAAQYIRKGHQNSQRIRRHVFEQVCKFYFRKYRCDIYHFGYSGVALAFDTIMPAIPGKKVISCLGTAENVKPFTEKERSLKLQDVFARADLIHAVSKDMQQKVEFWKVPTSKIFVNHPAVDTEFFSSSRSSQKMGTLTILSIGRLVFQKGFMIGLKAIEILLQEDVCVQWIIAGEGPEFEALYFNIHLMGLQNQVTLAGKKTKGEILQLYKEADIFFLPSITEGMANVVLEAMSMQLPVVSSDCGGMPEVIEHDVNGLLCPNYDYACMAASLSELCKDAEKRTLLGQAARKTIEKHFSLERYINVFEDHYYKIAEI